MGRSFFFFALMIIAIALLFVPISLKIIAHYDMNRKKFCFAVYLFSFLKIIGGYIATYKGGFAVHISKKKALLLPYSQVKTERKRFSFMRSFRLHAFHLTTETGAEYLAPIALAYTVFRIYFFTQGGDKDNLETNVWLSDGDVLRISASLIMKFTMFIILKNIFTYIKERLKGLWRKSTKKSTI